jgi:hypothetical protein
MKQISLLPAATAFVGRYVPWYSIPVTNGSEAAIKGVVFHIRFNLK